MMAEAGSNLSSFDDGRPPAGQKAPDAFRTISEVSVDLDVPQHVLRFWEGKFTQIKPLKRGGGRRYYRPEDVDLLRGIQHLLYGDGYTIKGVQKLLREHGVKFVVAAGRKRVEQADRARTQPKPQAPETPVVLSPAEPAQAIAYRAPQADQAVLARVAEPETNEEPVAATERLQRAAQVLSRLKAMRRDYDLKLQAAKNGRLPARAA
jgi:DNA-binding transcriptional MerR regulator